MTSQLPASPLQDGDPLETALQALFHEAAAALVPPSLHTLTSRALADATSGRAALRGRPAARLRRIGSAVAGLAAVAVVLAAVGLVGWYATRPDAATGGAGSNAHVASTRAIDWDSGLVHLTADGLHVVTAGRTFTAEGITPTEIHSDPGGSTYRTLEIVWPEAGVEMRMNIYFAADDTHWWATEIRTYDGQPRGDWLIWHGHFFETPLGGTWSGDLDLTDGVGRNNGEGPVTGDLHISGMQLTAFGDGTRSSVSRSGGVTPAPTHPSP